MTTEQGHNIDTFTPIIVITKCTCVGVRGVIGTEVLTAYAYVALTHDKCSYILQFLFYPIDKVSMLYLCRYFSPHRWHPYIYGFGVLLDIVSLISVFID